MSRYRIGIVGGGIGGISAALALAQEHHDVTLFESVEEFKEVGAGIRVPPNASRHYVRWGVDLESLEKEVSRGNRFVDWKGHKLLDCPFDDVESRYGARYYFIHRADLIRALSEATQKTSNAHVLMGSKIIEYDLEKPAVKTSDGKWHAFDLIICADGIKSTLRNTVNGSAIEPQDTGDVAYRILVPVEPLLNDPETRQLVTEPWATHWIGPEAHAVGYPLRGGKLYNIIIDVTHATDLGRPIGLEEWRSEADNTHLIKRLRDWCPQVRKMCQLTGQYLKWKLADFDQLDRWIHPSNKVVLLGDNAHPFMPYMAQGAAMAVEDAATLTSSLAAYPDIGAALKEYENRRRSRAAYIARNTRVLQQWWHLHDGPERDKRDHLMKQDDASNPMYWGCRARTDWLFGYDASKMEDDAYANIPALPPYPDPSASVYGSIGHNKL